MKDRDEQENAAPRRSGGSASEEGATNADEPLPEEILARLPEPMRVWHLARMVVSGRLTHEEAVARLRRASGQLPAPSS